jgi:hypothetical protein
MTREDLGMLPVGRGVHLLDIVSSPAAERSCVQLAAWSGLWCHARPPARLSFMITAESRVWYCCNLDMNLYDPRSIFICTCYFLMRVTSTGQSRKNLRWKLCRHRHLCHVMVCVCNSPHETFPTTLPSPWGDVPMPLLLNGFPVIGRATASTFSC